MSISIDIADSIRAYRKGATSDMLQADFNGEWGVIWMIPPHSPDAMVNAGRQFTRSRASRIRYIRRAILTRTSGDRVHVVICTVLPAHKQTIYCLADAQELKIHRYLEDDTLRLLADSFVPTK